MLRILVLTSQSSITNQVLTEYRATQKGSQVVRIDSEDTTSPRNRTAVSELMEKVATCLINAVPSLECSNKLS